MNFVVWVGDWVILFRKNLFHSWTVCKLFFSKITQSFPQKSLERALKLTDLVDYKFIVWFKL